MRSAQPRNHPNRRVAAARTIALQPHRPVVALEREWLMAMVALVLIVMALAS